MWVQGWGSRQHLHLPATETLEIEGVDLFDKIRIVLIECKTISIVWTLIAW